MIPLGSAGTLHSVVFYLYRRQCKSVCLFKGGSSGGHRAMPPPPQSAKILKHPGTAHAFIHCYVENSVYFHKFSKDRASSPVYGK